jgi:hypothetical protein
VLEILQAIPMRVGSEQDRERKDGDEDLANKQIQKKIIKSM